MMPKNDPRATLTVNEYLFWKEVYRALMQITKAIKRFKLDPVHEEHETNPK